MASLSSEYKFISEPDCELKCVICFKVAKNPLQHVECGKLVCKDCLEKHGRDKPCPNCKIDGSQYFKDNNSSIDIQALTVKCYSVERGCEWEGTVGTLEYHVITCKFTLVPCPKHCKDDHISEVKLFMRKDVEEHLEKGCPNRDYECEHCGEKGTYVHITHVHDETCGKKILPCPNKCGNTMPRQDIEEHVTTECENTVIPCKYKIVGCKKEMKRGIIAVHEQDDDKAHLHIALNAMVESKEERLQYKLPEYQKKKESNEDFIFSPFYTSPNRYRMALRVYPNGNDRWRGTHVSVYVHIHEGKSPFNGTVTFKLLNQLRDKNHYTREIIINENDNACSGEEDWGVSGFIAHSELAHDSVKNTQYLKDDTLYFRIKVQEDDDKPWLRI